jgi:hypothetical protein
MNKQEIQLYFREAGFKASVQEENGKILIYTGELTLKFSKNEKRYILETAKNSKKTNIKFFEHLQILTPIMESLNK